MSKNFYIVSSVTLILTVVFGGLYNYNILYNKSNIPVKFVLKIIPILFILMNTLVYVVIHGSTRYLLLVLLFLMFCMFGDISLMLYIPEIEQYNNIWCLIIGGGFFCIARIFISIAFTLYYKRDIHKTINFTNVKLVLSLLLSGGFFASMVIIFSLISGSDPIIKILLFIYLVSMSAQIFTSMIRINGYSDEFLSSQIVGFIGTLFFTVSDSILFWSLFIENIYLFENTSISLYWIGIYLISVSVHRTNNIISDNNSINNNSINNIV